MVRTHRLLSCNASYKGTEPKTYCSMATTLDSVLNEALSNKLPCNNDIVPHFLNFIRSQCNWVTATPYVDALTVKFSTTQHNGPGQNNIKDQTRISNRNIIKMPNELSESPFKDSKLSSNEFYSPRQKCDKHNGWKQYSKNDNKKYVKLTQVTQVKRSIPNISDHSEFPLITEISPRGMKVASLLEKRLKEPAVLKDNSCMLQMGENCEPTKCGIISSSPHLSAVSNKGQKTPKMNQNYIACNGTKNYQSQAIDVDNYDVPLLSSVTEKEQLDQLVRVYCSMIDNSQIPNVTVELYFLFSLLTARDNKDRASNATLLNSVSNCVYFASSVLNKQRSLLEILDHATLHTLCGMPYLQEFTDLRDYLTLLCERKTTIARHRRSSIQGVSFQADTDNRRNFPSDTTFHTFRKQRDLFYELLRDWKEQHFFPNWASKGNFAGRVKYIINLSCTSVNFAHLARLIQSHLMTVCDNEGFDEGSSNEEIAALKRSFPDKFEKLQERFQVPLKGRGPCPPPSFHGSQEFLHDFVEAANSVPLNQHLINCISTKIVELNQLEFSAFDCKMTVDEILREKFFSCLHALRTLARFLGYLVFMPYQNSDTLSADIINCQRVLRNTCQPPLNVCALLLEAVKANRLILTVPWIVEYLSMMDPIAQHLDYYSNMCTILFKIYKSEANIVNSRPMNKHFLRLVLGWLFETPNFPISNFFLRTNGRVDVTEDFAVSEVENLDALEVIDENIIYSCCPYLAEFRVMLEEYLIGIQRKGEEVRKINPVSADGTEFLCIAQLEKKLEDNFFHLQSPSVKKTVEFVAERISSKAIQYIRNEIIPSTKENLLIKLKAIIDKIHEKQDSKLDGHILSIINENANTACCEMKSKAVEFSKSLCKKEIKTVMPLLLQSDVASEVIQICCDLSYRTSVEKVLHWIRTYVTVDYISVDLKIGVEKLHRRNSVPNGKLSGKSQSTTLTTDFINNLRDRVKGIYCEEIVTTNDVLKSLLEIRSFLSNQELLPTAVKLIGSLSVDYAVFLLAYKPHILTEEIVTTFNNLWCEVIPDCTEVSNLLSIRNMTFISFSPDTKTSWHFLRSLIVKLLQHNRISVRGLEMNCMKIVKQEWSDDTMYNFSNFLKELLSWYRTQSSELEFVEIIEWLAWFCEPTLCDE